VRDGRAAGVQEGQEGLRVVEQIQVEEREARRALQGVQQEQGLPGVGDLVEGREEDRVCLLFVSETQQTTSDL